jgi:hypothetical protein
MSERIAYLQAIGDRLEEMGEPGPAAAVRLLAYLLESKEVATLNATLSAASELLSDRPEMREVLDRSHAIHRASLGDPVAAEDLRMGDLLKRDEHGMIRRIYGEHELRDAIGASADRVPRYGPVRVVTTLSQGPTRMWIGNAAVMAENLTVTYAPSPLEPRFYVNERQAEEIAAVEMPRRLEPGTVMSLRPDGTYEPYRPAPRDDPQGY